MNAKGIEQRQDPDNSALRQVKAKKPYAPPAIIYREPLEAMAAVCSPGGGGKARGICTLPFS